MIVGEGHELEGRIRQTYRPPEQNYLALMQQALRAAVYDGRATKPDVQQKDLRYLVLTHRRG